VGGIDDDEYRVLAERMNRQVFSRGRGPSFIAYHICEWLVESLQPMLERLDDRIDSLEDQVVLTTGEAPMRELFALKRDLVDMRRRVAPLRDVMQRLGSHGVLFVEPEAEVYFRDVHDDVMRGIELLDTYRDILSSALDLHLSSVSNRLNRVMKQLTVVATMFMPLSFIVGLFGTNFTRMPFGSLVWFILMFVLMFLSIVAMFVYTWKRT
jgi:magnesium transporter